MGRRALRKISPKVDLSDHLKVFEELPIPWDTATLFSHPGPLQIDVGSGKGLFLTSATREFPQHNFLGVEISQRYARFTAARLAHQSSKNGCVLHGNARKLFGEFLPDNSLFAVHVYFPDPWWKKRHHKRRLICEPFLRDVQRVLTPGGHFHFWTDVHQYFFFSLQLIATKTQLQGPLTVLLREPGHDMDYQTHFERRMRLRGTPFYRAQFLKIDA